MIPKPSPYIYNATLLSVYDGDTINLSLDLGMGISYSAKCRLEGIDTPELRSKDASEREAAKFSKETLQNLLGGGKLVVKSMDKPDKYGRLLVRVWNEAGECINELMKDSGGAVRYDGGRKISWASLT